MNARRIIVTTLTAGLLLGGAGSAAAAPTFTAGNSWTKVAPDQSATLDGQRTWIRR